MSLEEVKSYKWLKLSNNPPPNSVLYVLDSQTREVEIFVTDKNGKPVPLKQGETHDINISDYIVVDANNNITVIDNKIFAKKPFSGDNYIVVTESTDSFLISLEENTLELIENKQNDLSSDGTGKKYPTVDAVNNALANIDGDKNFTYEQSTPSTMWVINHNLNKKVSVTITDSAGTVVFGQVTLNDGNTVIVEFNIPFWGYAYLN